MVKTENYYLDEEKVSSALSVRIPEFLGPYNFYKTAQGQSNPTFIVKGSKHSVVLRKKPHGKLLRSAHMVEREYRVMKALFFTDVPVPRVYYLCENEREIGSKYFVMEFVDGLTFEEPQLMKLSTEQRKKVYDSMNSGLASLHSLKVSQIGLFDYGKQGNYFDRQLSRWSRQYDDSQTEKIPEMEELREWLFSNVPVGLSENKLVHGDWRIDNLIFSKDTYDLIAVVDWELSTLGDPRADLASQIMQWSMPIGPEGRGLAGINRKEYGLPTDDEYIELYSKRVGLSDIPDLSFAVAFCFFRMGSILQGVKRRAIDGNASSPEKAIRMGEYVPIFARAALKRLKL